MSVQNTKPVILTVRITPEMKAAIRFAIANTDQDISDFVRSALGEKLDRQYDADARKIADGVSDGRLPDQA